MKGCTAGLSTTKKRWLAAIATIGVCCTMVASAQALPIVSWTYSPTAPVVNQSVHFDGSASTCDFPPCNYIWYWNYTNGHSGGQMGNGPIIDYTFDSAGTKVVILKVVNSGSTHGFSTLGKYITVSP
jgi:hypothetical protein